jgi:GGDEF domain-containing protein
MNPRSAERLARAARAAQALSETLWEALHEELHDPIPQRVAELSERLADVSATVALLARPGSVEAVGERPSAASVRPPVSVRSPASDAPTIHDDERPEAGEQPASPDAPAPAGGPRASSGSRRESSAARSPVREPSLRAVLVDELAPAAPTPEISESPPVPPEPAAQATPEIEIRDERHEDVRLEPARGVQELGPWIAAIERRLERYERDRAPFAVLLVELVDVERLRHTELPGEMSRLMGLVEAALAGELRPADSLTREAPGRYWLLAPDTDSGGARALVARLANAVRGAASHGGVPLEVAVGIAACPADGAQATGLAAHAEVALYAARAAGKPVA